jgi:twitching motility protein PilT
MPRLDHIVEHLFLHPGADLTLETNSPGTYRQPGVPEAPVFRQTLRTGQILLLFADLVPPQDSQALLAGQPVDFRYDSPKGPLRVHMEMRGADIFVLVRPFGTPPPRASAPLPPIPGPLLTPPPPPSRPPAGDALLQLIGQLPERRASHLHLAVGQPPFLRIDGQLVQAPDAGALGPDQVREALSSLAPPRLKEQVLRQPRFDFTSVAPGAIFHVRAQEGRGGLQVVVRWLPRDVPSPESLGLPPELLASLDGHGLWVVCAGPGQGTSSTLAALAQGYAQQRAVSVCSLESPLEFILEPGQGLMQQLEVGNHVASYPEALLQARDVDADLTVVGDLEDPHAAAQAVALAGRGRLVLAGLHARGAVEAVARLRGALQSQPGLQEELAEVLRGVFAQALVPTTSGARGLAWELLLGTSPVRDAILAGQLAALPALRAHTFEDSLLGLVRKGDLEAEVALQRAQDRTWLEGQLGRAAQPRAA